MGAVKDDVAVSVVMHQQNIVLTAEINQLSVQLRRADAAYRVGWQADQHKLCLAGHFLGDGGHIGQEVVFFCQFVVPGGGAAQLAAGHKNGVAGVGQQHHVTVVAQRQA